MTSVLSLKHPDTIKVRASLGDLVPSKLLGRGSFCAVFKTGPAVVTKMTMDKVAYDLAVYNSETRNPHLPIVITDMGIVGYQAGSPIYLFTTPLLFPARQTKHRALARAVIKDFSQLYEARFQLHQARRCGDHDTALALANNQSYPPFIRRALKMLADFIYLNPGCAIDLGRMENYMVDSKGRLVFMDPVYDADLAARIEYKFMSEAFA